MSDAAPEGARRRREDLALARRVGSFLIWWVILMSFWVWIDDSIAVPELLVGAGVAVLGAALAEVAQYQADTHVRIRIEWLAKALTLPGEVGRDFGIVMRALFLQVVRGRLPASTFEAVPVRPGGDTAEETTKRALLVAGTSVAPNSIVLGIDQERGEMLVHHLDTRRRRGRSGRSSGGS